jgi:hypothetical protein
MVAYTANEVARVLDVIEGSMGAAGGAVGDGVGTVAIARVGVANGDPCVPVLCCGIANPHETHITAAMTAAIRATHDRLVPIYISLTHFADDSGPE